MGDDLNCYDRYRWEYYRYNFEYQRRRRVAALALLIRINKKRVQAKRRRRKWVREWIERRMNGREVLNMDSSSNKNYLRMDEPLFQELLEKIRPFIQKQNTVMREAISPEERLGATLRFLATVNTYRDISYSMRIAGSALSGIMPDTLKAIVSELEDECIHSPTGDGWLKVEEDYRVLWNFPHCVGALDGKHINFRPPRSEGARFRNYKGHNSIVLLALVDAKYKFLYIDVGQSGRSHDATTFKKCSLSRALNQTRMFLPPPNVIPGDTSNTLMPYVIVADEAFPMSMHLMKPYASRGLTYDQRIFNYRLSRARRVVENAFGILANRFRVLLNTINLCEEKVNLITRACCVLHNFILARKPVPLRNIEGEESSPEDNTVCTLRPVTTLRGNNATEKSKNARNHFKDYFNGVGAVAWQHDSVLRGQY